MSKLRSAATRAKTRWLKSNFFYTTLLLYSALIPIWVWIGSHIGYLPNVVITVGGSYLWGKTLSRWSFYHHAQQHKLTKVEMQIMREDESVKYKENR